VTLFTARKTALQGQGMTVNSDTRISMQNYVAWQNNVAKEVGLALSSDKYLSITQSSDDILASDRMVQFAANLAKDIKGYK